MSVLTDIFTSLSNKIRSKLGTSISYTPTEAISAIDDVYTKGITDTKVGNAGAGDVLSGKTFTNNSSVGASGSMTNNGAVSQSLNCGGSYTVPAGYHNGSGKVTANSLASQTGVDSGKTAVTAGTMVSGYQGWVNGSKITGTFAGQEKTVTAGTSAASVTPDSGKYLTKVTYNPTPSQSKSASPSTSAQTISPDSGKLLSSVSISAISPQRAAGVAATTSGLLNSTNLTGYVYFPYGWHPATHSTYGNYCSVTQAQAQACHYHTGTVTVSTRGASVDIGQTHSYRYVNTNGVPNSNSGTYTPTSNSSAHDMGTTNSYRYVNTNTVYNAGVNAVKNTNASAMISHTTNKGASAASCTSYGYVNNSNGQYGHVHMPIGYYTNDVYSWAPEIRMTQAQVKDFANQCGVGINNGCDNIKSWPKALYKAMSISTHSGDWVEFGGRRFTRTSARPAFVFADTDYSSNTWWWGYCLVSMYSDAFSGTSNQYGSITSPYSRTVSGITYYYAIMSSKLTNSPKDMIFSNNGVVGGLPAYDMLFNTNDFFGGIDAYVKDILSKLT